MLDDPDLQSLISRAQGGDRAALDAALADGRERLAGFIRMRLGTHLRHDVEIDDVLQETFARALASIARFMWAGEGSFQRWLNGIAEHVILDLVRKQKTRRGRVLYVEKDVPHPDPAPSTAMRRGERLERLRAALDSLPPDYREAIRLVRIDGLRVKEAAERMGRTQKAVMHILARGLKQLKDRFGDTESLSLPLEWPRESGGDDVS